MRRLRRRASRPESFAMLQNYWRNVTVSVTYGEASMSLESTEKECAAVATAPRVSLADIEGAIRSRYDIRADTAVFNAHAKPVPIDTALRLLSICILVLRNGFTIIGKSAPASAENFSADLGRKLAYEDAIRQIWPLMGFNLRQKLHDAA